MISVVIPLYNKEKSVRATLESVRTQSYTDWECIVVNDGSTDESLNVVQDFIRKEKGEKWKVVNQTNAGVSAARNAGIVTAKGEYIAFLDGDDLWTSDYLATQSALINDYPNAGLYSIGYIAISTPYPPSQEKIDKYNQKAFRGYVENPWIDDMDLYIGSTCSSKDRLMRIGMLDTRMTHGEDLDLCWRLILDGGLVRDSKCCAFYRVDAENRAMNRVAPLEKHIPYYVDKYVELRSQNADFRRFFDSQMIYRLYPYLLDMKYKREASKIAQKFDYSQLKWSMHFRMLFPRIYYYYRKIFGK